MSKPTADWERVGDQFYRKVQLYSPVFDQDLELENYFLCGAPYSGALALHRDENKLYAYAGKAAKSTIDIYSCAGKLIRSINWDKGPIKGLGWSEEEKLLVVSQDGTVRCYSDLSDDFTAFTLGHGAEERLVVSCKFWLSGFVALLGENQLVSVANYDEPRPKLLAIPPSDTVISWTVIPPAYTLSRSVEVLLAIGQTINVVDASDSEDRQLQNGPFKYICVSPNGRFIALYTEDGRVWVISSDFQDKLSEYSSKAKTIPKDMQWCGNDSVVLAWEDEVHMVGPNGAVSKYYYDGCVKLVPDVDGIRILTNEVCEFLQKVPDVTEDTFRLGSTSSASILLDTVDQLENMSPKADDNIQLIKPNLVEAVDSCVSAASLEYSIHWQKQLLKAASFGKAALELYDSDEFVTVCETLRVLNAVRNFEIGLPLSYDQFVRLNPERLIQRLVTRQQYQLALRLSEHLHLSSEKIYVHWARQKVRVSTEDEETICKAIVQKINGRSASYEEIARAAYDEGRQNLAISLLNYEPQAAKQVPLLLNMSEDTIALDKAIESGDTDLVLFVLLHLRKKLPLATFFRTINTRPMATALVESTAVDQDRELLKDLYYQDDRRLDGSILLFAEALAQPDIQTGVEKLRTAAKLLQDAKENTFQARSIDETQRLMRLHEALDKDPTLRIAGGSENNFTTNNNNTSAPSTFAGLSVNRTIRNLILLSNHKRALRVSTDFKVSDKTYWWIRLRALVASRNWRELEEIIAKEKKSQIGWEAFFNEILGAGNVKLAGSVVPKCTGLTGKERGEMFVKCGMVVKAGEEALKGRDREGLEALRAKASGREVAEIERMISQLSKGR